MRYVLESVHNEIATILTVESVANISGAPNAAELYAESNPPATAMTGVRASAISPME